MTEEEARNALFQLHFEYMTHPPKERLKLYDEYQQNRSRIREELIKTIYEQKEKRNKVIKKQNNLKL